MIKRIILAILLAVVVWAIAFYVGFWPRVHPSLSLVTSIVGAIAILVILLLSKKLTTQTVLLVTIGSAIGLAIGSLVVTGPVQVRVDCSIQPPTANPDEAKANPGDVISWLPSSVGYTVEFKQSNINDPRNSGRRSPVKNLLGSGEEISIRVVTSTSSSRTVDVQKGYFWYNITCDNGNHVDPKVKVPPQW